jgi:manganese-dependent inorganic pyrophosphatase
MSKIYIFGHKNPDTDTITSSKVMEIYCNKKGMDAEAVKLGNLNKETKYVFNYLNIEEPKTLQNIEEGQSVILVDHNEFSQSIDGIEKAKIEMVIDHHRISNFQTTEPLYYRAEPVGCTGTVIYKMFKQEGIQVEKLEATLMLSSIISDTLLFKSPTCTDEDKKIAEELQKISGIDVETYGLEMLKAGTDLSDLTAQELIEVDAKEVMLGNVKAKIAQVNTASIPDMMKRKEELEQVIKATVDKKGLDVFLLAITDIINSNSQAIVIGNRSDLVEKSYNVKLESNTAFLEGIVSRKKQIIPIMTKNA